MKIKDIAKLYNDFLGQVIRVYKDGEMTICEYAYKLPKTMTLGEYENLMNEEVKAFDANGVAIHFYI